MNMSCVYVCKYKVLKEHKILLNWKLLSSDSCKLSTISDIVMHSIVGFYRSNLFSFFFFIW